MVALCMLDVDYVQKAFDLICFVPGNLDGNENCNCCEPAHGVLPLGTENKLSELHAYFERLVYFLYNYSLLIFFLQELD
jgi:hypothetical protein